MIQVLNFIKHLNSEFKSVVIQAVALNNSKQQRGTK